MPAYYPANERNTDSFSMQARQARLRVADPSLDPDSARVLAQQQYTERENARQAAGGSSFAPDDPRNAALMPPSVLGQRPQLPGGGFGPAGPIDVNSYAGSRYAAPQSTIAQAGPSPAPAYAPGSVDQLMFDTGHDTAYEGGIRRQMLTADFAAKTAHLDATRAGTDHTRLSATHLQTQLDDRATESAALTAAVAPPPAGGSVGIARQIMGGGFGGQFNSGAGAPNSIAAAGPDASDPSMAYLRSGGRNPAMASALRKETPFSPQEITLPSGARVIRNSSASVIPDPTQTRPEKPIAHTLDLGGGHSVVVGPGNKYFDAGSGEPLEMKNDKPLGTTDWMMAGRPEGSYVNYRKAFDTEQSAYRKAQAIKPSASSTRQDDPGYAKLRTEYAARPKMPTAAANAPAYRHEDVQAELKRRGLTK
jgi:hypothetical protein